MIFGQNVFKPFFKQFIFDAHKQTCLEQPILIQIFSVTCTFYFDGKRFRKVCLKFSIFPPKNLEKIQAPKIRMRRFFSIPGKYKYFYYYNLYFYIVNKCKSTNSKMLSTVWLWSLFLSWNISINNNTSIFSSMISQLVKWLFMK